jgi:DNA-binding protein YbaB
MAFDPLPAPSTFASAILAIENQLAALDARLATLTFTAQSADKNITIVVDASIEVVSVTILPPLLTAPVNLTTLASTLVTVVNQALAAAHTRAASEAATAAAAFNLQGVCAPNAAMPNYAGFAQEAASLTAQEPAVDARVAAMQFPGQVGVASAVASGHLDVVSLTIARVPDYLPTLSSDVGNAINQALGSAKKLVDTTIGGTVDTLPGNIVKITDLCLFAWDTIQFGDRSKLVGSQSGTFAAMANAGGGVTHIGNNAQVGNVWSRAPVVLANGTQINGFVKTTQTLTQGTSDVITGTISQNTFLQLPNFAFTVNFPAATHDVTLPPNTQQTLSAGSYGALLVNGGATLSLSSGTYFFTSFDIESNATISCSSGSAQVVVYVSGNVIFRGRIVEKTPPNRPKFFLGAFGTGTIAVGGPFTGTLAAPQAQITLNTVGSAGHSGAFFGQSIQVDPDTTITWFPFGGTPSVGTF